MENENVEMAILKVQSNGERSLTTAKEQSVRHLVKGNEESREEAIQRPSKIFSLAQELSRMADDSSSSKESKYMELRFIVPTSEFCERSFSTAGYALSDRVKSCFP